MTDDQPLHPEISDDDSGAAGLAVPGAQLGGEGGLDLGNLLGGLDLDALMGAAAGMQQQLARAQQLLAETVVEGTAGGGLVRIEVTGDLTFRRVTISPDAVDADDLSMLEDLVLAALRDAATKVAELGEQAGDMGDLGEFGSLFGG